MNETVLFLCLQCKSQESNRWWSLVSYQSGTAVISASFLWDKLHRTSAFASYSHHCLIVVPLVPSVDLPYGVSHIAAFVFMSVTVYFFNHTLLFVRVDMPVRKLHNALSSAICLSVLLNSCSYYNEKLTVFATVL